MLVGMEVNVIMFILWIQDSSSYNCSPERCLSVPKFSSSGFSSTSSGSQFLVIHCPVLRKFVLIFNI